MAGEADFSEILVAPIARMIREIGQSIGEAQKQLDKASMDSQAHLATDFPDLAQAGYEVTWYQLPEVTMEMKVAVHLETAAAAKPPRLFLAPINAKYKNTQNFAADGSSTLKIRIVPVPPHGTAQP